MNLQKVKPLGRKLKFIISAGMLALFLILAFYSEDLLRREFYLALAFVAGLNVVRVISNNNITIEK